MLRLYDSRFSGSSWKVRILLNQLGLAYERITLDLEKGEAATHDFVKLSRFSRVPVLQLEDGRTIVESGAILLYLAQGTPFLPDDPFLRAETVSWLMFEQNDLQRPLAWPRVYHLRRMSEAMAPQIARFQQDGYIGLAKLERWLAAHDWLVGDAYCVADLAVSAYVSLAHQGGYEMERFPAIQAWLARVVSQPGWIGVLHGEPGQP